MFLCGFLPHFCDFKQYNLVIMKIRSIIYFFIINLMFLVTSCKDCSQCERDLKSTKADLAAINADLSEDFNYPNTTNEVYDFCVDDNAVLNKSKHNTRTGIANLTIPIPYGSHLKLEKKNMNYLLYHCYGKIHNDSIIFENKQVGNLTRKKSAILTVEVIFKNYGQRCNQPNLEQEKKKTSEILGDPLVEDE